MCLLRLSLMVLMQQLWCAFTAVDWLISFASCSEISRLLLSQRSVRECILMTMSYFYLLLSKKRIVELVVLRQYYC
ncbi:hypothetical protein PPACK8108_LOCUS14590 [Phakopsora pachyrhizi]|uniref:Secreted protein n=1 Tax=Phakopsora pachyrhizi TaxID=170000 RepID=A0AAV0B8J1_PHAPC|nr:hypothetical protein PPACK8108_LOCUS14590 [Phakopsora pachyrhizi]